MSAARRVEMEWRNMQITCKSLPAAVRLRNNYLVQDIRFSIISPGILLRPPALLPSAPYSLGAVPI